MQPVAWIPSNDGFDDLIFLFLAVWAGALEIRACSSKCDRISDIWQTEDKKAFLSVACDFACVPRKEPRHKLSKSSSPLHHDRIRLMVLVSFLSFSFILSWVMVYLALE